MTVDVFRPHAMSAFLRVPASLFYNHGVDGKGLESLSFNELAARICGYGADNADMRNIEENDDIEARCVKEDNTSIRLIETGLLRQLTMNLDEKRPGIRTGMAELNLRRMDATVRMLLVNPNITVTELASECCLNRKQFERLFSSLVGINPKEYARIVRFQRALAIMQEPGKHILNRYSDKLLLTKYNETTSRTTKADDDISKASLATPADMPTSLT